MRQLRPEFDGIFFRAKQRGVVAQQMLRLLEQFCCIGMVWQRGGFHHMQPGGAQHSKKTIGLCNAGQRRHGLAVADPVR